MLKHVSENFVGKKKDLKNVCNVEAVNIIKTLIEKCAC
jgi:hypothetical protein